MKFRAEGRIGDRRIEASWELLGGLQAPHDVWQKIGELILFGYDVGWQVGPYFKPSLDEPLAACATVMAAIKALGELTAVRGDQAFEKLRDAALWIEPGAVS